MSASAFSRRGAFLLVAGGIALFLAMLWLISADADFAGERGRGQAHAASNGLNGYAGLVRLVEAQGYRVERSRNPEGLKRGGLLVLTPSVFVDAEEIAEILEERRFRGPTLIIMPKWWAGEPSQLLPPEVRAKFKRGWVTLGMSEPSEWPKDLPAPYRFEHKAHPERKPEAVTVVADEADGARGEPRRQARTLRPRKPAPPPPVPPARWAGMGLAGQMPTGDLLHAQTAAGQKALITDPSGRVLAFGVHLDAAGEADRIAILKDDPAAYSDLPMRQPVIVLADPDLANNYGLADATRAAAALALIDRLAGAENAAMVTFDMTLNGFGASENLLTLAFRPPFLAATLSLLVALLIVGWRAFRRFGPAAASGGPDIAFGKRQLILNGAGLILRARRFRLLGKPYAALSARRLAERLGLTRADPEAIDAALARRLPQEEPFSRRAARMEAAAKPAEILAAAQGLDDLATRLQQGQSSA